MRWFYLDHVTVREIYISISTFTRFMVTKFGGVLTTARRFSTQALELSPATCFRINLLAEVYEIYFEIKKINCAKIIEIGSIAKICSAKLNLPIFYVCVAITMEQLYSKN